MRSFSIGTAPIPEQRRETRRKGDLIRLSAKLQAISPKSTFPKGEGKKIAPKSLPLWGFERPETVLWTAWTLRWTPCGRYSENGPTGPRKVAERSEVG